MTSNQHDIDHRASRRIALAERAAPLQVTLFGREPLGLVCAALALAWIALVCRIASIW